jgi:hypothetical protein
MRTKPCPNVKHLPIQALLISSAQTPDTNRLRAATYYGRGKQEKNNVAITDCEICIFVRDRFGELFDAEKFGTT